MSAVNPGYQSFRADPFLMSDPIPQDIEYLFIGGSQHGEFQVVRSGQRATERYLPASQVRTWAWDSIGILDEDMSFRTERYELRKLAVRSGKSGLEMSARAMVITPSRSAVLPDTLARWALEMILWREGLNKVKPEKYPV